VAVAACRFDQALKAIVALEPGQQEVFVERLERIRHEGHNWGWGVGDDMDDLIDGGVWICRRVTRVWIHKTNSGDCVKKTLASRLY
jgi:hypothetical protein